MTRLLSFHTHLLPLVWEAQAEGYLAANWQQVAFRPIDHAPDSYVFNVQDFDSIRDNRKFPRRFS
jgi:hypothetical protein